MPLRSISASSDRTWKERAYQALIVRSWWLLLFLIFGYLSYTYAIQKKQQSLLDLERRKANLESERQESLVEREDLMLQINSQSDPAWIQMMLMKGLGVVPEGQLKVYFKKDE